MKFDPHIHSVYSGDARSDPLDILIQAEKKGFGAIAISDHNVIEGSRVARSYGGSMIVVPSIEISTAKGHILGLGCDEIIPKGLSAVETLTGYMMLEDLQSFHIHFHITDTVCFAKLIRTWGLMVSRLKTPDIFSDIQTSRLKTLPNSAICLLSEQAIHTFWILLETAIQKSIQEEMIP